MTPIATLKISKDFPRTEAGNKIHYEKISMMIEHLEKKYVGLPRCCGISDSLMRMLPDGTGEVNFYIICENDKDQE